MTANRDFDVVARAWLDLMPDEAPDRVIEFVMQAVDTTPQVRAPWRRRPWRFPAMNRPLMAAVATAVVVAVGGGLWLSRSAVPSAGGPSPIPTVTTAPSASLGSPSPSVAVAPEALRYAWLGEVVDAPGLPASRDRAILQVEESTVELAGTPAGLLLSDIASAGQGALELVARNDTGGCSPGDIGRYAWSISPKGSQLQLSVTDDECASRRAAFAGSWQRAACRNPDNLCLGDLDAGTHKSLFIGPRLDEGEPWVATFGALSYTVPDGWSNTSDYPDNYVLMRSADYAGATDAKDGTKNLLEAYTRPGIAVQDAACAPLVKAETGRSVDELIAHVVQHPGLGSSMPRPITIDGQSGQMIDVSIEPTWTQTCPEVTDPIVLIFTEAGRDMTGSGREQIGIWRTDRARLILLDLGDGDVLLLMVTARNVAGFDALMNEAMPIVESVRFK